MLVGSLEHVLRGKGFMPRYTHWESNITDINCTSDWSLPKHFAYWSWGNAKTLTSAVLQRNITPKPYERSYCHVSDQLDHVGPVGALVGFIFRKELSCHVPPWQAATPIPEVPLELLRPVPAHNPRFIAVDSR